MTTLRASPNESEVAPSGWFDLPRPHRPDTGAGFHGLIGFDFDGDGTVDVQTFIVGPDDEIPELAQFNGPSCHGITNVGIYFTECL